jgi:hypothetical protein
MAISAEPDDSRSGPEGAVAAGNDVRRVWAEVSRFPEETGSFAWLGRSDGLADVLREDVRWQSGPLGTVHKNEFYARVTTGTLSPGRP